MYHRFGLTAPKAGSVCETGWGKRQEYLTPAPALCPALVARYAIRRAIPPPHAGLALLPNRGKYHQLAALTVPHRVGYGPCTLVG